MGLLRGIDEAVTDEVHSRLTESGLSFLFSDDPGSYERVIQEFTCSFEWLQEKEGGHDVYYWKFVLGGRDFRIRESLIREWFGFPEPAVSPRRFTEHDQSRFWKRISGRNEWFVSSYNSSAITDPVWKIIHHVIAISINTRTARARAVTLPDMDILLAMEHRQPVDWLASLADRFESIVKPGSRNRGMGGGSLITLIAQRCSFTFGHEECESPTRSVLDLDLMKNMHIVKRDGKTWDSDLTPHQEVLSTAAAARRRAFKLKHHLYCLANLTPSPAASPARTPPAASEPVPPITEELPPAEPPVETVPPATDDPSVWRARVSADIADLKGGVAGLRSELASLDAFTRAEAQRAREESEWLRSTLMAILRGQGGTVHSGASPLHTTPPSRFGEVGTPLPDATVERVDTRGEASPLLTGATVERVGDSSRDIARGDDEATS